MAPFPYVFPFLFDNVSSELLDHDSDSSVKPYIHIEFTKAGETTYDYYTTDRILKVDIHQDPFREDGTVILANHDQHFLAIDLLDYKATISFGLNIEGTNHTNDIAPYWVVAQTFRSEQGVLTCKLYLKGIISTLRDDRSSGEYTGSGSAKSIANSILTAGLTCYSHCTAWEVIWHGDTGLDSINIYAPSDAFSILLNTDRLDAARQLIDLGTSFMRPEADGKIHMRIPKTTGTDYDHEFSLDGHVFFWHVKHKKALIPNSVSVRCETTDVNGDAVTYTGTAQDSESVEAYEAVWYYQRAYDIQSDAEAADIAEGVLANIKQNEALGKVEVPISFYAQVCDYIKITDKREGTETVANIGSIDWRYEAGKYRQILGVGGWWNRRRAMGFMQRYIADEPIHREFPFWITITLPATKLEAGKWINMLAFVIPHYRTLFVKHYSIQGGGKLHFASWEETSWVVWDTMTADSYYLGSPIDMYDSYDVGGTPACFIVENDTGSTIEGITASVAFDCQYLGGSQP